MRRFLLFLLTPVTAFCADTESLAFFESKIRPVLAENCYECHSADAAAKGKLKGGLQLDTREGIRRGGDTGPAVVPGKPEKSLLLGALRHENGLEMPPKNKLSGAVIADFAKWIAQGAPDPREGAVAQAAAEDVDIEAGKRHWAFQPLTNPEPPEIDAADWARTGVDRFVRAKQEAAKIAPNRLAKPRQLVRRAYFDLIGLPPSPEQVDAFLADAKDDFEGAWGRLIDELLASPHYGERWGRHWLDLVRFAESNGYAFDKDRANAWRYRDWVIRALNADLPYDEFVRRQLTGDLIAGTNWDTTEKAERALELISATGFIVSGPFTTQQTQKERERSRYEQLDDVIHTLGASMLGLTIGCARCHDHKYDPVGMHDYYELAAMFSDVGFSDTGVDLQPHVYRAAKAAYDRAHNPLTAARAALEKELEPGLDAFLADHAKPAAAVKLGPWQAIGPFKAKDFNVAFADPFGPEIDVNLDLAATYEEKIADGKVETRAWSAQPDWVDGEARNDILKGANSAFYLQREIHSPRAQSLGLSVSGNDGIKVWINGYKVAEERRGGDAKADELKVNLPLVKGPNVLFVKIANGGGDAGFYFQTSLEKDREPKKVTPILKVAREKWNAGQEKEVFAWFKTHDLRWAELNAAVVKHAREEPKPDLTLVYAAKTRGTTYQFGGDTYKVYHLHRGNSDNKNEEASPGFLRVLSREREGHWLGIEEPKADARWTAWKPVSAKAKTAKLEVKPTGQIVVLGEKPAHDTYTIELAGPDKPTKITGFRIQVPTSQSANFVLNQVRAKWVPAQGEPRDLAFETAVASFVQNGFRAEDVLAKQPNKGRGWAIHGGIGREHELVLIPKAPLELAGGKLEVTLVQESSWPQHLITHLAVSATTLGDVAKWAAKPAEPPKPDPNLPQPREALADWLTDVDHGAGSLLARVMVNRLWQHHFGRGIVATPSDFGTRGEAPTHPELLDWLARQLLENGWRLKPVHRLIMTSSVYLQSGEEPPGGMANDPENLLYWRKPARRLEAEIIRDNLLAVSGKLDPKPFGKGTLDANSPRRSVYLTVKRGQLIEMLQLFDWPDAMQSIGDREISTVAPQALAMLNSGAVRNWAVELAKRARPSATTTVEEGIDSAYQIVYGRLPSKTERTDMSDFIRRQTEAREGKADAAFQDFCHLLLCSNEFVFVD